MQDRHRHQRAVVARRHDARRDVVRRIVARRDLLALAQGALPARHVVVVDLGRRRHRRVGEAQPRGVELVAFDDIERVGRLLEGDDMLAAVGEVADHDRGQRILALQPHQMAGVERHADDVDAGPVRDQLAPVAAVGRRQRRHGDAEVDGAALVGQDEELVAAVVDAVAHAGLARRHQARHGVGVGEVDQPALGGLLVAGGDDAEAARRAFLDDARTSRCPAPRRPATSSLCGVPSRWR